MDDTSVDTAMLLLQNLHGVFSRVSGMNNDRFAHLGSQTELLTEPVLLDLPVRLRPVIIQSDLPYSYGFLFQQSDPDLLQGLRGHRTAVGRMYPQCVIYKGIFLSQFPAFCKAVYIRGNIYDSPDSCRLQRMNDCIAIF